MKKWLRPFVEDQQGGAMVETALALPIFLTMIWGIVQYGLAMFASHGVQNALGEGARFATLCVNPTVAAGCQRPSNHDIIAKINASRFGESYGSFGTPTVTPSPATASMPYIDLRMTYSMPTNFLIVNGPVITFTRTKRVYVTGAAMPDPTPTTSPSTTPATST